MTEKEVHAWQVTEREVQGKSDRKGRPNKLSLTLAGVESWTSTRPSPAPHGGTSSQVHSDKAGHN